MSANSESMRAAVTTGVRSPIVVQQIPIPKIGPDDALVRVVASGICRSDWHVWNGDWGWLGIKMSSVLGHEIGGVVEAVGANVRHTKVGMRVTIPFTLSCGACPNCRKGAQNLCDFQEEPSTREGSGGWAQYMCAPNADMNCVPLPDGVDELSAAALGCRFMTAWRAVVSQGALRSGETIAIFGCGGVGLAAIEIAAVAGGRVIAIDVDDQKLSKAKEFGADVGINVRGLSAPEAAEKVRAVTEGNRGVDLSIDALGSSPTMLGALRCLKKGGRLSQVGLTSQEDKGEIAIPTDLLVCNEWQIRGSLGNPVSGYHDLLSLVARGKLSPTRLVSECVKLSEVPRVLDDMDNFKTRGFVIITDFSA